MSKKTFEQVRKLKQQVRTLKKQLEQYSERENRLVAYIFELEDKMKLRKARVEKKVDTIDSVIPNGSEYGRIMKTFMGDIMSIMRGENDNIKENENEKENK